uniref:CSON010915 protein n=1 Tax=Culicoides sonorensis TaxID=179676 RepID=A0A336MER0_CULSO
MVYVFFFIITIVLSSSNAIVTRDDNLQDIINGYQPNPEDAGFTVGVMLHFEKETGWCGGVLISDRYVLSSAHCLRKAPSSTVLLGATNINSVTEVIPVVQTLVHPKFGSLSYKNDIALLRLSRAAKITENVYPIRLPTKAQKKTSFKSKKPVAAGWGRDGKNQVIPGQYLMGVNVTVISNFDCWFNFPAYITDTNICTSSSKGTPCEGDDGGPLYLIEADGEKTLIGIVSYQFSLGCTSLWPAVYTRVSYYLDWIEQNSDVPIRET